MQVTFIKDVKASGTHGGSFTAGAWRTRDLNTLEGNTDFVSLNANQFTLDAGTYLIEAEVPAMNVNYHIAILHNITDGVTTVSGKSIYSETGSDVSNDSAIKGIFTINSQKTFEIRHKSNGTQNTFGFGYGANAGVNVTFTQVKITKIAN